jgi:hypothetical protein
MIHEICDTFGCEETVTCLHLDIAKAFDRLWGEGLTLILFSLSIPGNITHLLAFYLKNRPTLYVSKKAEKSTLHHTLSCFSQGSVLGSTLFLIYTYINGIPDRPDTQLSLFADDTALLAKDCYPRFIMQKLRRHAPLLEGWCTQWRVPINLDRTAATIFTRCLHRRLPELRLL